MFKRVLDKMRRAAKSKAGLRLKENDLDVLKVLCIEGRQKQYTLEKSLTKRGKGIAHSTVTGKLKKLSRYGFVNPVKETDGFVYYELTPVGLGLLFYKGRVDINKFITHFEKNQMQYFEALTQLQPNLINRLKKAPLWFVIQLTEDLWVIYYIAERSELRRQTIKFVLAKAKGVEPEPVNLGYEVQPLCVHRIEVEGKGICIKQKENCLYRPTEVAKCPILKQQMLKELEKLEKY